MNKFSIVAILALTCSATTMAQTPSKSPPSPTVICAHLTDAIVRGNTKLLMELTSGGAEKLKEKSRDEQHRLEVGATGAIMYARGLLRGQPVMSMETVPAPTAGRFVTQIARVVNKDGQDAFIACAVGRSESGQTTHHHSGTHPSHRSAFDTLNKYLDTVRGVKDKPAEKPI